METLRSTLKIMDCVATEAPLSADQKRMADHLEEALAKEGRALPRATVDALVRVFQLGVEGQGNPVPTSALPVAIPGPATLEPVSSKEKRALKAAAKQALGTPSDQTQFRIAFQRIRNKRRRAPSAQEKWNTILLSQEDRDELTRHATPLQHLDFVLGSVPSGDSLATWCEFPALFELLLYVSRSAFGMARCESGVDEPLMAALLELGASPDTPNEAAWQCKPEEWPKLSVGRCFSARQLMAYLYQPQLLTLMGNHRAPPAVTTMPQSLLWWAVLAHLDQDHGDFLHRLPHHSEWVKNFKAAVKHIIDNEPPTHFHAQIIRLAVAKKHPMAEFLQSAKVLGRCSTVHLPPPPSTGWAHRFGKLPLPFLRSKANT